MRNKTEIAARSELMSLLELSILVLLRECGCRLWRRQLDGLPGLRVVGKADGKWQQLDEGDNPGKRAREATLEDLDIRGVGSGSVLDVDAETLAYTINSGLYE